MFKKRLFTLSKSPNNHVWVYLHHSFTHVLIEHPHQLQRLSSGGLLPNDCSDQLINDVIFGVHKIRNQSPFQPFSVAAQVIVALSIFLAVFWLGSGALFKLESSVTLAKNQCASTSPINMPPKASSNQYLNDVLEATESLPKPITFEFGHE